MHELSLAEHIIEQIEAAAVREGFSRVWQVRLEIGALACVEVEALRQAWVSVCTHTLAAEAELQIKTVAGLGLCPACGQRSALQTLYDDCPQCGHVPLQVLTGTQMRIKDLDVE